MAGVQAGSTCGGNVFSVDSDGGSVSAETSGHLCGEQPDRAAVQRHDDPGEAFII